MGEEEEKRRKTGVDGRYCRESGALPDAGTRHQLLDSLVIDVEPHALRIDSLSVPWLSTATTD
jgi:hypothetical protein